MHHGNFRDASSEIMIAKPVDRKCSSTWAAQARSTCLRQKIESCGLYHKAECAVVVLPVSFKASRGTEGLACRGVLDKIPVRGNDWRMWVLRYHAKHVKMRIKLSCKMCEFVQGLQRSRRQMQRAS